jgi:single-stranded-DNA-specific exonuclease
LIAYGGHPGAAGLTLLPENIDAFRRELSRQVELHRDPAVQPGLQIDAEARLSDLSLELEREVARLAPFGQGNPQPRFVTFGVNVVSDRRMGADGSHRKLQICAVGDEGPVHELLWFGGGDAELSTGALDVVYTLGVNDYRGERALQLLYVAHRPAQPRTLEVTPEKMRRVQVVDLRRSADPLPQLPAEAVWYAEGALLEANSPGVAYAPRFEVSAQPGRPLVLWSIPPSGELLHWLVESSGCETVHLCARATADDAPAAVIRDVARMVKYAVNRKQTIDIGRMAARLGQTEAVIRTALLLLEGKGIVRLVEWLDGDCARIEAGNAQGDRAELEAVKAEFEALLAEVRAYRRFVARARVEDLGIL